MQLLKVDFNARTEDDKVRLDTVGALQSLAETGTKPGDHVVLCDGEIRAIGRVCEGPEGLEAEVDWRSMEVVKITTEDATNINDGLKNA